MDGSFEILHLKIDDWSKLFQIAAIVLGGTAAYIKWFRGRLYKSRLELNVQGILFGPANGQLLATVRMKNLGLSKLRIEQVGSGLRMFSERALQSGVEPLAAEWKHRATFPVFEEHGWVESNEVIEQQLLVDLPEPKARSYRLELWIASPKNVWNASAIVTAVSS